MNHSTPPNVTIRNTNGGQQIVVAADNGVRQRGPAPRWPNQNQQQVMPGQMAVQVQNQNPQQQQLQQQQPIIGGMQQQPIQNQMTPTVQLPQQAQQLGIPNQGPQIVNQQAPSQPLPLQGPLQAPNLVNPQQQQQQPGVRPGFAANIQMNQGPGNKRLFSCITANYKIMN